MANWDDRRFEADEGRGDDWREGGDDDGNSFDVEKSNSKMLKYSFSCKGDGVAMAGPQRGEEETIPGATYHLHLFPWSSPLAMLERRWTGTQRPCDWMPVESRQGQCTLVAPTRRNALDHL